MSLPQDDSSKRHSRNGLYAVTRSSIVAWLRQRNPIAVSLVLPSVLVFLLTTFWGQAGGILGWLLSLFLAPLLFIALASKTEAKWKRYGIAAAMSGASFVASMVVATVTQITAHKFVASIAESAFLSYYSPTVGAKSRRFANNVIASVTLSSNVDQLQREIDFLLSSGQSRWLTADQLNKLRLKRETVILIRGQKEADGRLYSQVLEALNSPISLQSYKSIVSTATEAPRSPRFEVVIPESLRQRL